MNFERISVLLVEDNPGDARLMREAVREAEGSNIRLTHEDTLAKALARLEAERFDIIMLDLSLPDADGLETLVTAHSHSPSVPIVVLTGLDDEALAVRALREGAQDYLVKGQVTSHLLVRAMRYATERKRAVEALQRSEEYFRSLIENALDIITVLDTDGNIRYGSPSLDRVLGYEPGHLNGSSIYPLIHPEDQSAFRERLSSSSRNPGASHSFEFRLRHATGSWLVLEGIGKSFASDSAVAGLVLNSRDITQRKGAEEALREANETLRAVIETSPLAIYSLDLEGRVKSWNAAAEAIFGFSEAEVLNRSLPIIFPQDQPAFRIRLRQAALGKVMVGDEGRRCRKDGSPIEVSIWSAQLRDATGAVTGIVAAVADNTERKRLEEQFRQAQKMEAVGRLAGGVAHDFNNLLTVITGYCQMLLDRLPESDPLYGDMQQVLKAADRATTLTKQLLAFSRKQIVQPKIVDLRLLIMELEHMLHRLLGEDIELLIHSAPGLGKVRVDPGQLEQVIVNLVVNARDAMPSGGKLTIEMHNMDVSAGYASRHLTLAAGSYVLLAVSDTGSGITPEVKTHLFEPFFTTKEKGRGTGLGLSTSYGIIKQNQGEILVYSEIGYGTVFKIYLPRVQEPASLDAPLHAEPRDYRGSETILVVEDEDGVRRVVGEMLQKQGYRVLAASGGPEAIELCLTNNERMHLLITDVVMPKMSGRELANRIRAMRPDIQVLFVSGYTDSAIVHHGVLDPGTDFLQKPFAPEQLAAKVRAVLEGNKAT
ncbi:MAG TPA: PAS domain S-box protein [Bryobacteraceae bacterium]|nr:PAS domain S-box protein [Bryobacteraceae bacterium]